MVTFQDFANDRLDMNSPSPPPAAPGDRLLGPLRHLLRPLVRLLLRRGVTFPVLAELLRGLFVEVASRDLLSDPRQRTDSRISLLTGVHRKELRRLREQEEGAPAVPAVVTLSSQIIARWLGLPEYSNGTEPRPLRREAAQEGEPSFDALVRSVTSDVRPRAVLEEFLRQGLARLDGEGRVRLNVAAFLPRQGSQEQLFYFARNLHDHLAAAAANVEAEGAPPFLDRSVHYDRLPRGVAEALEAAGRDAAQETLLKINRLALDLLAREEQSPSPDDPSFRFNLGVYVFAEKEGEGEQGA